MDSDGVVVAGANVVDGFAGAATWEVQAEYPARQRATTIDFPYFIRRPIATMRRKGYP